MALARFSPGCDVYVFEAYFEDFNAPPQLTCCGCALEEKGNFWSSDTKGMHRHLLAHKAAGHNIPTWLLEEVESYPLGEEL